MHKSNAQLKFERDEELRVATLQLELNDVKINGTIHEADNKSYGQETRERNERHRKWKERGVEPPLTREEIRRQAAEAREMNPPPRPVYRSKQFDLRPYLMVMGAILAVMVLAASCKPNARQQYLNAHPECRLIATEELPEERVYCGKACTRAAVLETYQCGSKTKKLLN